MTDSVQVRIVDVSAGGLLGKLPSAALRSVGPLLTYQKTEIYNVKLVAPDPTGSCTINGVTYTPDETGHIDAPSDQIALFLPFGFTPAPPRLPGRAPPRPTPLKRSDAAFSEPGPAPNFDTMGRNEMFDYVREAGVKTSGLVVKNDSLRAICRAIAAGEDVAGMAGVAKG